MSRNQLIQLWRNRFSGYLLAFARRPSKCRRAATIAARLDLRKQQRPLTPAEVRVRAMFRVWNPNEMLCAKILKRFSPN